MHALYMDDDDIWLQVNNKILPNTMHTNQTQTNKIKAINYQQKVQTDSNNKS